MFGCLCSSAHVHRVATHGLDRGLISVLTYECIESTTLIHTAVYHQRVGHTHMRSCAFIDAELNAHE